MFCVVFRRSLFVVGSEQIALDFEIDQLTDRHIVINANGLLHRNLKCPVVAESDIALAGRCVDVDAQTTDGRFALEKRDVFVSLRVFFRHAQIKLAGMKDVTLGWNFKGADFVVRFRIQNMVFVNRESLAQVNIVGVGSQALPLEGSDYDVLRFDERKNLGVG